MLKTTKKEALTKNLLHRVKTAEKLGNETLLKQLHKEAEYLKIKI